MKQVTCPKCDGRKFFGLKPEGGFNGGGKAPRWETNDCSLCSGFGQVDKDQADIYLLDEKAE